MESAWICPNDRHLALRAKLRAGWSVRTTQQHKKDANSMTEEELGQIKNVILKASMLEEMEQERIGCLVHRLNVMRQNSMGDGKTTCILCAESFKKFSSNTPIICMDCKTKVCSKCCVDYSTGTRPLQAKESNQQMIIANWLCKICSENRELWKRSGAWFFQSLPVYKLPEEQPVVSRRLKAGSPKLQAKPKNLVVPESPAASKGHHRSLSGSSIGSLHWAKPTKTYLTSSSDGEESSDDDGITLGKQNRPSNIHLKSSETGSIASDTSGGTDQQSLSTSSSGMMRRGSKRRSFRSPSRNNSPSLPRVKITQDYDSTSLDSISTDASHNDQKMANEMANLHGGSMGSSISLRSDVSQSQDKDHNRGIVEFSLLYDPAEFVLHVHIIRAKGLIAKDKNGFSDPYVKLHLLPGASRATKLRSKTKSKTLDPVFDQTLSYLGINEGELPARQLLLTVLDEDRFSHNDFIGETIVPLSGISPAERKTFTLPLQPMYALSEKQKSPLDPGRVRLGLRYSTTENSLFVTVFQCAYLIPRNANDSVTSFVKVTLNLDDKQSMTQRTTAKRKTQNPEFNSEMKFTVSQENGHAQVARGALRVAVYNKDAMGQGIIGSFQLGINSEGERLRQWFNCLKNTNKQFNSWQILNSESPRKSAKGK